MRKWSVWLLAVCVVGALALVEWRPWLLLEKTAREPFAVSEPSGTQSVRAYSVDTSSTQAGLVTPLINDVALVDLRRPAIRAQLTPVRYTTLTAELNAKVQEMPFKEGELFDPGAVLVIFDCVVQKAQLARVTAELAIAQRLASANQRLLKLGTVSRVETENSLSELMRAQAHLQELEAIVSKCEIVAPYRGKVADQRARSEQFVQVGQPLLEILDTSGLELEFIAPSSWSSWLRPGYMFDIDIDETGKTYPAIVTRVAARIDSVSQTFKVAAQIDGEFLDLSPGMSGTISVTPP